MPADKHEEVFEIVDSRNKVIGTEVRGVCHKEGLCHRAVYCFVFNTSGQVLLQQRSERSTSFTGAYGKSAYQGRHYEMHRLCKRMIRTLH